MTDKTVKEPLVHIAKRDDMLMWKRWAVRLIAILLSLLMLFSIRTGTVFAAEEIAGEEIGKMFGVFKGLSNLFIKFAYGAMVLIFAVGMVKSGLTAQAAQQFGAAGKVSGELMNVLGGVVIFVFGILSYPIAEKVINAVISGGGASGGFTTDSLQLPGIGG